MSNGLFASFGIDIAQIVGDNLGAALLPVVLIRPTVGPTVRDPNDPTRVTATVSTVRFTARGFIEYFRVNEVDGVLILDTDRKVTVLAATITPPTEPVAGATRDQLTIEGKLYNVYSVLSRDPAAATYVLQVRQP